MLLWKGKSECSNNIFENLALEISIKLKSQLFNTIKEFVIKKINTIPGCLEKE